MALANYTFTVNLYTFLGRVASRLQENVSGLTQILNSRSESDAQGQLVAIVNERHRWLFDLNPALGRATTSLSLTTGTLDYNIPATLFRCDYEDIQFNDENDPSYRLPIGFLNPVDFRALPAQLQREDGVGPYPAFFTFNADASQIRFTGFSSNWSLLVSYRANPETFITSDITSSGSTKYFAIPDDFIDVLVLAVAIEIAERGDYDADRLNATLYGRKNPDEPGKLRQMQERINSSTSGDTRQLYTQGTPYTTLMPKRFAGIGSRRGRAFIN